MTPKMFLFLLLLCPLYASTQSVEVKKENTRLNGEDVSGFETTVDGTEGEVLTALLKYMKTLGKVKQNDGTLTIAEPVIAGKKYPAPFYATARPAGNHTSVWIGTDGGGEETNLNRDLEKIVRDFGVTFYRDNIQLQIDESVRALQAVEKQQTRLSNQNKDLQNKIEHNKREKIELEKSLIVNKTEMEDLTKKMASNAQAQDSIATATDQIKKVVEMHKERQLKVN